MLLIISTATMAPAVDENSSLSDPAEAAVNREALAKRLAAKMRTNEAFLKAAEKVVRQKRNTESASYLKRARGLHNDAVAHDRKGELAYALEDVAESTRLAIYAITLSNAKGSSTREAIIHEELIVNAEREQARKELLIKKGVAEVETFINTAGRLLKDMPDEDAAKKRDDAIKLLATASTAADKHDYDGALAAIDEAYTLSTRSVKAVKLAQNEIITFPKAKFTDDAEELQYEMKRNDTYFFFAKGMVSSGNRDGERFYKNALKAREEAEAEMERKETKKAVDRLKTSTGFLIKAVAAH